MLSISQIYCNTTNLDRYATVLWSLLGPSWELGWLESDEERWDEAIAIVKDELRKSDGFEDNGTGIKLKFQANIAVAKK